MSNRKAAVLDMTKGNAVRMILTFAIPLFVGNIFQQVYSMVDTMVAGYCLGDQAIAAIGATSSLYGLIIDLAWGLNSGFALIVTQAFGAHDRKKIRKSIGHMMVLDGMITGILTVLALIFLPTLMQLMNTPESIFDQAYSYMAVIFGGMLATICYNIMIQPMATIMDASGTFTAQNWGAKQKRRIRETLRKVLRLEAGYGFFCIAVVYLFGSSMIQITTGTRNPEMVDLAVIGLRIHFSMYPLLGVLLALRVSMQSMGEKTAPIISSAIELVLKFLAAIWLIPAYGFIGTAVTEPVTWVIMTLFLMTVYCIKTKKMLTEEKEKVIRLTTEPVAA